AIDSRITPYLEFWPRPNGEVHDDGTADYISVLSTPTDDTHYQARVDHQFNNDNSAYLRYTHLTSEETDQPTFPGEAATLNTQSQHLVTLEDRHIFSPRLLNTIRVGFSRTAPFNTVVDFRQVNPSLKFNPKVPYMGALNPGSGLSGVGVTEA